MFTNILIIIIFILFLRLVFYLNKEEPKEKTTTPSDVKSTSPISTATPNVPISQYRSIDIPIGKVNDECIEEKKVAEYSEVIIQSPSSGNIKSTNQQNIQTLSQPILKPDWREYETILKNNNITKLYHFTDRANLESIKNNGGLYSWLYCERNNVVLPKPGGNLLSRALDSYKGLQNYVRLSFVEEHPMMFVAINDGRLNDPIILEIDLKVIYEESTIYANENAAKNGVIVDSSLATFQSIRFTYFRYKYKSLYEYKKPYYQAEVLVLERIPIELILNIDRV